MTSQWKVKPQTRLDKAIEFYKLSGFLFYFGTGKTIVMKVKAKQLVEKKEKVVLILCKGSELKSTKTF